MQRYNAQSFAFHIVPESVASRRTTGEDGRHHFTKGGIKNHIANELPDGCGTTVLVNNNSAFDRALVILIRPPWLISENDLQAFARGVVS